MFHNRKCSAMKTRVLIGQIWVSLPVSSCLAPSEYTPHSARINCSLRWPVSSNMYRLLHAAVQSVSVSHLITSEILELLITIHKYNTLVFQYVTLLYSLFMSFLVITADCANTVHMHPSYETSIHKNGSIHSLRV